MSLLAAVSIYLIFRKPIHARLGDLFDPFSFSGDALQHIAPMWFVRSPELISHDYIQTYYLSAILPPLFKAVYAVATLVTSPLLASKIITVILSVVFILTVTVTSKQLAGGIAAYLTALFATGAVVKNMYFMGGIQRSFGIWLSSLALYLVCSGRVAPLGLLGVVAAMLYPAAAVYIVCVLTLILLLPRQLRGSASSWTLRKRVLFLGGCVAGCSLVALPQLLGGGAYGPRLSRSDEATYQEWGISGRYTDGDRGVPLAFSPRVFSTAVSGLFASRVKARKHPQQDDTEDGPLDLTAPEGGVVVIATTALCMVWLLYRLRCHLAPATLRCGIFGLSMLLAFGAATMLFPLLYIPSRYVTLGCISLIPVIFPCIWTSTVMELFKNYTKRGSSAIAFAAGGAVFVSLGWLHPTVRGLPSASGHLALFRFIRTLPADSVIAGWPRGIINQIPLFTARSVLLFEEGHQIFHRDCLEELRRRTRSIIHLYAATDAAPLAELQNDYKVTHLLLDKRHLDKAPPYFAPFDEEMKAARAAVDGKTLFLAELANTAAVYQTGNFVLMDLTKPLQSQ
jgi:hypothetical protein